MVGDKKGKKEKLILKNLRLKLLCAEEGEGNLTNGVINSDL